MSADKVERLISLRIMSFALVFQLNYGCVAHLYVRIQAQQCENKHLIHYPTMKKQDHFLNG